MFSFVTRFAVGPVAIIIGLGIMLYIQHDSHERLCSALGRGALETRMYQIYKLEPNARGCICLILQCQGYESVSSINEFYKDLTDKHGKHETKAQHKLSNRLDYNLVFVLRLRPC